MARGDKEKATERRLKALELRKAGMTYRQIGRELGVSHQQAWKDVNRSIKEIQTETNEKAKQLKTIELERLNSMLIAIWQSVMSGDNQSIATALKIMERRSRYLGLDEPIKTDIKTDRPDMIVVMPSDRDKRSDRDKT